jgi:proteic killer suppression protein
VTWQQPERETVIRSWRHKGLEEFFVSESMAGIRPDHAGKLKRQLDRLDDAKSPQDMNLPGWRFHRLEGALAGHYSVRVNGNWRMTFTFEGTDAILVDYQDYH